MLELHLLLLIRTNFWLSLTSQTLSVPQRQSLSVLVFDTIGAVTEMEKDWLASLTVFQEI